MSKLSGHHQTVTELSRLSFRGPGYPTGMTSYACPEFAATGLELQIIELQARREQAVAHGWHEDSAAHDDEIARLWIELAQLSERFPGVAA